MSDRTASVSTQNDVDEASRSRGAGRTSAGAQSLDERRREPVGADRTPDAKSVRGRQREEFGGISWGATFFGWLSAAGLTAILAGLLGATGAALALNKAADAGGSEAETIGIAGGIGLLIVLAIAYFCGGYVAGRMARFDGVRQGVGVWLWGLIAAAAVALLAAVGGSKYNVLDSLNLPRIPVDSGALTTGGIIALVASLVVTLLAAVVGAKAGERFHHKVDRVGLERQV